MARWFVDRCAQRGIPSVSLRRLLPEARFVGCHDLEVSGCTADSRRLDPGQVFVAVRGLRRDGHDFVGRALERGAAGVLVERFCPEAGRPQVVVPDARRALTRLCLALAGDPTEALPLVGVTGTRGKTATSLFLRSILEASGARVGLIGPYGWSDGIEAHPAGPSTPGAEELARMLAAMVGRGCSSGLIEVGDDALRGRRVEGLAFDAALVTLLRDDPAPEPEAVRQRRRARAARLFRAIVASGVAVVNADDPDAELLGAVNLDARRVSFGMRAAADVSARIDRLDATGSRFLLRGFEREATVALRPVGERNVTHALAAAALAWARGLTIEAVVAGLEAVACVPGRLEAVGEGPPGAVRIDRARTEAELRQALVTLGATVAGRIICVVGSEGLQSPEHRRGLAQAAEAGAHQVILTTDNPRTEDPDQILDDLLGGFRSPGRVQVEPDRRRAIETALALAGPGDVVLIAGKGRQTYQILADRAHPFDDAAIAEDWFRRRRLIAQRQSA
jgi:UDP-N-acetylmuramoyl-L-alanyl-D-glutamate--2,6-diaminopimelate ligase